ncbi:MAG: hypothetical protein ABEK59_12820 [Halobacteria archaeon]
MLTLLGDASLTPGEVVQVAGSPLVNLGDQKWDKLLEDDKSKYLQLQGEWDSLIKSYAEKAESTTLNGGGENETAINPVDLPAEDKQVNFKQIENNSVQDVLCNQVSKITGENFAQLPQTVYRVEAVTHKFNLGGSKGFSTEVALVSPY